MFRVYVITIRLTYLSAVAAGLLMGAFLQTWPDTSDANFAGPLVLALMLLAISLLTGEIVLVGRVTPATSALAPFPGNGV